MTTASERPPALELEHVVVRFDGLLAIADLATHNNVFYASLATVFDQHAPIIKLRPDATRSDYIGLLTITRMKVCVRQDFWSMLLSNIIVPSPLI